MNEQIKQLAKQAGFGEQWFEEHPTGCSLPKPLMLKEYTELIVKECISVAEKQHNTSTLNHKPSERFTEVLKRHFGVK